MVRLFAVDVALSAIATGAADSRCSQDGVPSKRCGSEPLGQGGRMDTVQAQIVDFDSVSVGTLPSGWIAGVTGRGAPRWAVVEDATAPSAPRVLEQSGSGTFPWCVRGDVALADGF